MPKQMAPLSLRISKELNARLEECAARLKQKKHALAQAAVEAAVDAIEKNNYKIVVPIAFEVSEIPVKAGTTFPPRTPPPRVELNDPRPKK